ncbi:MAG TPA: galactokinase [Jatrophihabitans sp.]|jgi:galactokinase|nr:galactokinase [Jatrophihabitans sp.]
MQSGIAWRAPGRVNLIGEHTDYNAGFALPFAIAQGCTATVERGDADEVEVTSAQRDEAVRVGLANLDSAPTGWARYPLGVVWAMRERGLTMPGLRVHLDSDVPGGAGLSSSAALVCSVATAIAELLGLDLAADELLAITRAAENEFVGAPTGGLDQLAALRCTAGHALLCDMRAVTVRQVRFDLAAAGLAMLVIDTRASHRHATGEYGARRATCEEAARLLGVAALRDIDTNGLDAALARLRDDTLRRCVRHVVSENNRVQQTVARLDDGDIAAIGPLLTASHESLRHDYRVTIAELDLAVATALTSGALGARMTGGGFGGSVIVLVPADQVDACADAVTSAFARQGFTPPVAFTVAAMAGAHRVGAAN